MPLPTRAGATALVFTIAWTAVAQARMIDTSPRVAILLPKSQRFLARDTWTSVALYTYESGSPVRRFDAIESIFDIDASLDEKTLVAVHHGGVSVWDVDTGQRLWSKSFRDAKGFGATLSPDGGFVGICWGGFQGVFAARTGDRIGAIVPENSIQSVAVAPGGAEAFGADFRDQLIVKTATGDISPKKGKGYPMAYSVDGQRLALQDTSEGSYKLRIISLDRRDDTDVGVYRHIGLVRPASNGGFRVTGITCGPFNESPTSLDVIGTIFDPTSGELTESWRLPGHQELQRMDFDPITMVGVCTSYRFVTEVVDLRTGDVLLRVDNSANYEPTFGLTPRWRWAITGVVVLALLFGWMLIWRRRAAARR